MKEIKFRLIIVLLIFVVVLFVNGFAGTSVPSVKVEQWKRTDIELISSKTYDNPFLDVSVDAVFTHAKSGESIRIPGFWNGDNHWVVRFSPIKTGKWHYVIKSDDNANSGLLQKGEILCINNNGLTELDKRGFVKISPDKRFFTYADGKPVFLLGDTHWQAPDYERWDECNDPDCDKSCGNSQFKHLVKNRISKGFNMFQTYPDVAENDGGGNPRRFNWWADKTKLLHDPKNICINPRAFIEHFDVMMDYLAGQGLTIALGFGVHQQSSDAMAQESMVQWARYMVARYASYPVIWITAQEINARPKTGSFIKWCKVAETIYELDGYKHPLSAHTDRDYVGKSPSFNEIKDLPWHGFWAIQGGHGKDNSAEVQTQKYYKKYWNSDHRKPYLEMEANYEQLKWPTPIPDTKTRETAWRAIQSGSYGYTYGASGIWAMNWEANDGKGWESYSKLCWYQAKDLPGSFQMGYMKSFYELLEFEKLEPRFDDTTYIRDIDYNKDFLSSNGNNVYVLYSSTGTRTGGAFCGLDKTKYYKGEWFNPRTGERQIHDNLIIPSINQTYPVPGKPDANDWVFLLKITGKTIPGHQK
jgi:hypothetical protein